MSNLCLDVVTDELARAGIPYQVAMGGKHVRITYGAEYEHLHVVSATPSGRRAHLNERAQIRRDLARLGYVAAVADEPAPEIVPVSLVDGQATCSSVDLASSFGKAHKDVLRAIDRVRDECGPEFDRRNFTPIEYQDQKGRAYRAYRLTRDGFSLVAMGFTGSKATDWKVKFIAAFNALEAEVHKLVAPSADLVGIRSDIDALVAIVGDVEARIAPAKQPYVPPRQAARHYLHQFIRGR